jgi:hypothetical protein
MNISDRLSNMDGWFYALTMIVAILAIVLTARLFVKYYKEEAPIKRQKNLKKLILSGVMTFVVVFFLYFNFGAGQQQAPTPVEETGEYKDNQEVGPEMTEQELEQDALDRTTKELRIQSDDSLRKVYLEESEKKSDALTEKYLEQ